MILFLNKSHKDSNSVGYTVQLHHLTSSIVVVHRFREHALSSYTTSSSIVSTTGSTSLTRNIVAGVPMRGSITKLTEMGIDRAECRTFLRIGLPARIQYLIEAANVKKRKSIEKREYTRWRFTIRTNVACKQHKQSVDVLFTPHLGT